MFADQNIIEGLVIKYLYIKALLFHLDLEPLLLPFLIREKREEESVVLVEEQNPWEVGTNTNTQNLRDVEASTDMENPQDVENPRDV